MKSSLAFLLPCFLILHAEGQTIIHSKPEIRDFDRFRFQIITRKDNRLLVYKAVYLNTFAVFNDARTPLTNGDYGNNLRSGPTTSIEESSLCIYDSAMNQLSANILPLPRAISGISFLVYDDFFYLFYQSIRGHTIYCMASAIDLTGHLLKEPVCLDSTINMDINYQSQIYSVIYSENKEKIVVFKLNGLPSTSTVVTSTLFDKHLHSIHHATHGLRMAGAEYLSEFQVDNAGNFIYLGLSRTLERNKAEKAILFTLPPNDDSLTYDYILSGKVYTDDIHILIDNTRGRYILSSFFSEQPQGNVEGLFTQLRDAARKKPTKTTFTILSDSLRREARDGGPLRAVFDSYFLGGMHLLGDGSFTLETQQLIKSPDNGYVNRWNNLAYRTDQVGANFIFYDSYEHDHYWPWNNWRLADPLNPRLGYLHFSSSAGLIARFDDKGIIQWVNKIDLPQRDFHHVRIGYTSFVTAGKLYFLYNVTIRRKRFLTAQCIDPAGELNTDPRLKEDVALAGQNADYIYYPRLAQQVGEGEMIIPCQRGREICLALLKL